MKQINILFILTFIALIAIILFPIFFFAFPDFRVIYKEDWPKIIAVCIGFWFILYKIGFFLSDIIGHFSFSRIMFLIFGFFSGLFIIYSIIFNIHILSTDFKVRVTGNIKDMELEIVGYSGNDSNIIIPDRILNYRITKIGEKAFSEKNLSNIIISPSIDYISDYAFSDNDITNLSLPQNIKYIGHFAFANNNIITLEIGNNVTFYSDTFSPKSDKASYEHYWERYQESMINISRPGSNVLSPRDDYDVFYDYKLIDPIDYYTQYNDNNKNEGIYLINLIQRKSKPPKETEHHQGLGRFKVSDVVIDIPSE